MPPKFSQILFDVQVFKGLFPTLNNLALANIAQGLIPSLDCFQLVPKHMSKSGNQRSQPLKQNIIAVNKETSVTKRTRTLIPQLKEQQLKAT